MTGEKRRPTADELAAAIDALARAGMRVLIQPARQRVTTVQGAADYLDCEVTFIRRHLAEFKNAFKLGSQWRIPLSDLDRFMEQQRERQTQGA